MNSKEPISDISTKEAFETLFKQFYAPLCRYAYTIIKDKDVVEDIVHDFFVRLWEKRTEVSKNQSLKSYLYTSVHNRCLNYIRDTKKFAAGSEYFENDHILDSTNDDEVVFTELQEKVLKAIQTLPEKCREVFELCKIQGKKYAEVAELLGISIKTVENQMGKALKVLREELGSVYILASLLFFEICIGVFDTIACSI